MRQISDAEWNDIQENEGGEFPRPKPGGYVAVIVDLEDIEEKEYLSINWDFEDGPFKGYNQDTFVRLGFWPSILIRSYKVKALPYFKAFKTCLEASNRGYHFRTDRLSDLEGKLFGVVLGEEEYRAKDGTVKTRLYVAQTRSVKAIRDGDFKVPELKKLAGSDYTDSYQNPAPSYQSPAPVPRPAQDNVTQTAFGGYRPDSYDPYPDDGQLPF